MRSSPEAGLRRSWCRTRRRIGNLAVRGPVPGPQRPLRRRSEPLDPSSCHAAAPVLVAGKWRWQQPNATGDVQGSPEGCRGSADVRIRPSERQCADARGSAPNTRAITRPSDDSPQAAVASPLSACASSSSGRSRSGRLPRAPPACFAGVSVTGGQAMTPILIPREREKDLVSMAANAFDQQARDSHVLPTLAIRNSTDDRLSDGRSRARQT